MGGVLKNYFSKSSTFKSPSNKVHPFLVFRVREQEVVVHVVRQTHELLEWPDNTKVMGQWPGASEADYYHFHVIDLKKFMRSRGIPESALGTDEFKVEE